MFSFCKPVSSKKRFSPHRQLNSEFTFTLFAEATSIPDEEWTSISGESIFLHPDYLSIIEKCVHTRLQCRYVLVYRKDIPCGIIYFQVVDFKAGLFGSLLSGQLESIRSRRLSLFERYLDSNREEVLMRLFTCGNNLVSGEYGHIFNHTFGKEKSYQILLAITDLIAREEKLRGTISAILLKDYYSALKPEKLFRDESFSRFSVEPNMVVELPPSVSTLEEYTALFSKKYRSRARGIFKNLQEITVRTLDLNEIREREKEIYALYCSVFEKAKFRLMQLPVNYFSEVKKAFTENFRVKGYFREGKLVAFSSSFKMHDGTLEAHYIGFNYSENEKHDLYQNILYDMITQGLAGSFKRVNLGRTAAEIKTTVGAKPNDLLCYIKPQNTISRLIQNPFISFLQPSAWTPRNPFKEEVFQPHRQDKL